MATNDARQKWPTDRAAYEKSVRFLAKSYPDIHSYRAQVMLLDENAKLRAALEEIKNPLNWCAYDDSGCAKGVGERVDDWCGCTHPIRIAEEALAPCDGVSKDGD